MSVARNDTPLIGRTTIAWILAGLLGIGLACFFVLTAFAFHRALHWPVAGLIVLTVMVTIGLPVMILGPLIAAPLMFVARAWVWPRPLTDCGIGIAIALVTLVAGHVFFGHGPGRGLIGPIWVDVLCAMTSGAIAGSTYWRLAGEPHPPYSAGKRDQS
jgi:hypothetical protein